MEIVSKPDMRSAAEAAAYVEAAVDPALSRHLRRQYGRRLLRADVNVSVRRPGDNSAPAPRPRT